MKKQERCISLASHTIGLDNKKPYTRHGKKFYKPYRNYFATAPQCDGFEDWQTMENEGYAKSSKTEKGNVIFWLTRSGLDWLGKQLGIHIYDEEG